MRLVELIYIGVPMDVATQRCTAVLPMTVMNPVLVLLPCRLPALDGGTLLLSVSMTQRA